MGSNVQLSVIDCILSIVYIVVLESLTASRQSLVLTAVFAVVVL